MTPAQTLYDRGLALIAYDIVKDRLLCRFGDEQFTVDDPKQARLIREKSAVDSTIPGTRVIQIGDLREILNG